MAHQFTMEDEINYSMTSSSPLLSPVADANLTKELNGVFVDIDRKVALAGGRRQTANFGTVLVKATYGENASKIILPNGEEKMYGKGVFNFLTKQFHEDQPGLRGGEAANGDYEIVDVDAANEKIKDVIGQVALQHSAFINTIDIDEFIKETIGETLRQDAYMDKKINIQFLSQDLPDYTFFVRVFPSKDDPMRKEAYFRHIKTKEYMPAVLHPNSSLKVKHMKYDRVYVGQLVKTAQGYMVNVLRQHVSGMKLAIQHIKNGTKRPGSFGYMIDANEEAGVKKTSVAHEQYNDLQKTRNRVVNAPMLTIDLDNFAALMEIFKSYKYVEMQFKDSSTGIYFKAEGDNLHFPHLEAILSPTIQYVNGKTCLR